MKNKTFGNLSANRMINKIKRKGIKNVYKIRTEFFKEDDITVTIYFRNGIYYIFESDSAEGDEYEWCKLMEFAMKNGIKAVQ